MLKSQNSPSWRMNLNKKKHRGGRCHEHGGWCKYQQTECQYSKRDMSEEEIYTYKVNEVGSFAGPWDRSITDDLTLGVTTLNFDEYTKYQHDPKDEHFELKINREMYYSLEPHEKIDALRSTK